MPGTVPTVVAVPNKTEYAQGESVTVTFTVTDSDISTDTVVQRTYEWTGHDGEGNVVTGSQVVNVHIPIVAPDTFVLDSVRWVDTAVEFTLNQETLQAVGVA